MWWTFDSSQVFFPFVVPPVCLCLRVLKLHLKSLLIFISIYYSALPIIDQRDGANTLQRLQIVNHGNKIKRTCNLCYFICKHKAHLIYFCMFLPHVSFCFSFSLIYFADLVCSCEFWLFPCFAFFCTVEKYSKMMNYIRNIPRCIENAEVWMHISQVLIIHLARNKCTKHAGHRRKIKQTKQ